jgi:hypothetical protein
MSGLNIVHQPQVHAFDKDHPISDHVLRSHSIVSVISIVSSISIDVSSKMFSHPLLYVHTHARTHRATAVSLSTSSPGSKPHSSPQVSFRIDATQIKIPTLTNIHSLEPATSPNNNRNTHPRDSHTAPNGENLELREMMSNRPKTRIRHRRPAERKIKRREQRQTE